MTRSGRLLFFLLSITGWSCSRPVLQQVRMQEYVFSDTTNFQRDNLIDLRIAPYRDTLLQTMSRVLAESAQPLEKKQPEGPLGDYVADACLREGNLISTRPIDLAIFNHGGLRRSLPKGAITLGDVFELMPFDNELVVLTLRGSDLLPLLNFVASNGGAPVSGLRMVIRKEKAAEIEIGGTPMDTTRSYRVLTSDYLANGGDRYSDFSRSLEREDLRVKVRDAITNDLSRLGEQRKVLIVTTDGRIRNAE